MAENAEAVAANQSSRRNVTIEICNVTNNVCLADPEVYLESGTCHSAPQPTVRPLKTEVCNFSKITAKTSGAVGVLTYNLLMRGDSIPKEKIAIMFSVPYDFNIYENWMAVGIYKKEKATDESLFKEMYYDEKQISFVRRQSDGCCITFVGSCVDILCTMSPMGRAIMKVEVWDKIFSKMTEQQSA